MFVRHGSLVATALVTALAMALAPAAGPADAAPPAASSSIPNPATKGEPSVGRPLVADPRTTKRVVGHQWYRVDPRTMKGTLIAGARWGTYRPHVKDVGQRIRVRTAFSTSSCTVYRYSWPTKTVTDLDVRSRQLLGRAGNLGTIVPAKTVLADVSDWPVGSSLQYQWYRSRPGSSSWKRISTATTSAYWPRTSDIGWRLRVKVTGSMRGRTRHVWSPATTTVQPRPAPSSSSSSPKVVGSNPPASGQRLTVSPGPMSSASNRRYQWYRKTKRSGLVKIDRGAGWSFVPSWKELAYPLQAKVTGTKNGRTVSQMSSATRQVVPGSNDVLEPAAFGTTVVGGRMVARPGKVPTGATLRYAWHRVSADGTWKAIPGATASSYVPVEADRGLRLAFTVRLLTAKGSRTLRSEVTHPVTARATTFAAFGDSITERAWTEAGTWMSTHTVSSQSWAAMVDERPDVTLAQGFAKSGWLSWQISPFARDSQVDYVIPLVGTNDVSRQYAVPDILREVQRIADRSGARRGRVVVPALPPHAKDPVGARRYNDELRAYARTKGFRFVERPAVLERSNGTFVPRYSADGIHPNVEGSRVMADAIAKAIP